MILSIQNSSLPHLEHKDSEIWGQSVQFENENALITAASGTGKTSLFHLLNLSLQPEKGDYLIDGQSTKSLTEKDIARIRKNQIASVFQEFALFEDLSLWDNLQIKNQLTQHLTKEHIEGLLEQVGLIDKRNQNCASLSFGQKQRLCFVRAMCQPFDYLLLDEPFSHLDENNIDILKSILLRELAERNANYILLSLGYDYGLDFDKNYQL